MTRPSKSLFESRTAVTNIRRMFVLTGFAAAILVVHFLVAPVPDSVLAIFALYMAIVALYAPILRKTSSAAAVDRLQILAFIADITVLTTIYIGLSAWWMSSTVHAVIVMGAYAVLKRRHARIVAAYAGFMFVMAVLAQACGIGLGWSFLGAPSLHGNFILAIGVALLGCVELIVAVYIQLTLIRVLTRSEKRHRLIISAAREWIITTDTAGRISSANESTFELTGRTTQDVIGRAFADLLDQESCALAREKILTTLADGIGRTFLARYRSGDGSLRWVTCSLSRFYGESFDTEVLIVGRDATDRMQARRREEMLAETEKLAHIGSFAWDMKSDEVEWSDELYRIFRMERNGPLTTADFYAKLHPDDLAEGRSVAERSMQTGEKFEFEHRIGVGADESRMIHVLGRTVIGEEESSARMYGSVQDVTERNILTEQLRQSQKMEAVGRLAGGIAHDFNNVLTVIKAYTGFLLENLSHDEAGHADAEEISKAADKAASLTRQLGVFSRRHAVEPQVIDLNGVVSGLEGMLKRLVSDNVELEICMDPAVCCVRADVGQIEQVLMNLIVNAQDAMPDGGTLKVETSNGLLGPEYPHSSAADHGMFAMLCVSDTGSGMTEEVRARIFEPFFTTKGSGKGTGLGLSIVYGIVTQSGGHISATSEVGRGTVIRIYLPEVNAEVTAENASAMTTGPLAGTERILVVEDEEVVRSAVSRILRGNGYDVLVAANGIDAMAVWQTNEGLESQLRPIDMVLTDMVMPGMGGREFADRLKILSERTPVLFMSGYTEDLVAPLGPNSNERFIEKPFTADALLLEVRATLEGRESLVSR